MLAPVTQWGIWAQGVFPFDLPQNAPQNSFMSKERDAWVFQFITMVQTGIIAKYVCDPGDGTVPIARPMWAIEHLEAAFKVAADIPQDFTPRQAAEAFIRWVFHQTLEPDDKIMLKIVLPE